MDEPRQRCRETLSGVGRNVSGQKRIEACIESICQKGCRSVLEDIQVLERGGELPETTGLSREDIRQVLDELKSIMAIYDGPCGI